ncbi:hypothetical protein [Erwinia persicina]
MRKTITLKYRQTPPDPLELMGVKQQIIPKIEDNSVGALDWYSQNARYVPDDDRIISLEHLQQSRYKINYRFRWKPSNACLDIDAFETSNHSVNFSYHPGAPALDFADNHRHEMSDEL